MSKIWRGIDIEKEVPEFGLKLPLALLAPQFLFQFLQSNLVRQEPHLISPLDDLKEWLRREGSKGGESRQELLEVLLGDEKEARLEATGNGQQFDQLEYDLERMEEPGWECFSAEECQRLLEDLLEDIDVCRPAIEAEGDGEPFSLSFSFGLPLRPKNPGQPRLDPIDLTGMIQFDFAAPGKAPSLARTAETGIVRILVEDKRVGDASELQLSLAYPLEHQDYFLETFEALGKELSLK
jgi:hypothetical protein